MGAQFGESASGIKTNGFCSAAVPFFLIHEYYPSISPPGLVRKNWSIDKEGYASLPQGTGLCWEVDEAKLAELPKTPSKPE